MAGKLHPKKSVAGVALSNNGQGTRLAYVVVDRVLAQADAARRRIQGLALLLAQPLILGHVMAHEIGHLMLPHNNHTKSGLMKGQMEANDIEDARDGQLLFSADESEAIRTALMREGNIS